MLPEIEVSNRGHNMKAARKRARTEEGPQAVETPPAEAKDPAVPAPILAPAERVALYEFHDVEIRFHQPPRPGQPAKRVVVLASRHMLSTMSKFFRELFMAQPHASIFEVREVCDASVGLLQFIMGQPVCRGSRVNILFLAKQWDLDASAQDRLWGGALTANDFNRLYMAPANLIDAPRRQLKLFEFVKANPNPQVLSQLSGAALTATWKVVIDQHGTKYGRNTWMTSL